jgi:ADP-heptose:LPS heptosyltransferase
MSLLIKKKHVRLVVFRTGYLGDVLTSLPFIFYTIQKYGIEIDEVVFISLQKSTTSGVKRFDVFGAILGDNVNTHVLVDYSICGLRTILNGYSFGSSTVFIYLPLAKESVWTMLAKKIIFLISGVPITSLKVPEGKNKFLSEYLFFFQDKLELNKGLVNLRNFIQLNCEIYRDERVFNDFRDSIVMHINSQLDIKMWPLYKFEALIRKLHEKGFDRFVLIGGPADKVVHSGVVNALPGINIMDYTGKIAVSQTICALTYAKIFIGCDGGPMHMAAVANCKVLGFFTQREEISLWDPVITNFITLRMNVSCSLCGLTECSDNICVTGISLSSALNAVDQLLEGKSYQLIEH